MTLMTSLLEVDEDWKTAYKRTPVYVDTQSTCIDIVSKMDKTRLVKSLD